uniref:Cytochrome c oxidase subunit 2 n=1 Tax=Graptopsaltria nigrofuscata TaxID=93686 RepID=A0A344ALJ1_9HEMI|nr:cytochrome oxidase subunit II [Graptopsaltria nigrofuscata]AWV84461.1 cytochrome oxidase subunit II [Graptopsaltria nigrofuscata]
MSNWSNINMQDAMSPLMEQLMFFHDHTLIVLIIITVVVSYVMLSLFLNKMVNRFLLESQMIEFIWTFLPALMLIFIALPSLRLLYMLDEINYPMMTLKIIGHQWYWSYEYSDFMNIEFDSYMKSSSDLMKTDFRLLDVDNRIILPYNVQIRLLVSSYDVIHSWTIPSMGVKIDAVPGRLNQVSININRSGLSFGQCSEICGSNHSFMPIVIESINMKSFIYWLMNY